MANLSTPLVAANHPLYYELQKLIDEKVKAMSDSDLRFAYWLEYEDEQGYMENAIANEYRSRNAGEAL